MAALLEDQTLQLVVLLALLCALADWIAGTLASFRAGTFDWAHLADWLRNHLVLRVFPIVALAVLSAAINATLAGFPNADAALRTTMQASATAAFAGSLAALLSYGAETLQSLGQNVATIQSGRAP
jgi:hypothetical protein